MRLNKYTFSNTAKQESRLNNIIANIMSNELRSVDIQGTESLNRLFGGEGLRLDAMGNDLCYVQMRAGVTSASSSLDRNTFLNRVSSFAEDVRKSSGLESFSAQLSEGDIARQQAASIELNVEANRQFAAAEQMFPTVFIGYEETTLELPIDIAGVGPYSLANNPDLQFNDLRPLTSILSDTSFTNGDDTKMVPVFVDDKTDRNYKFFVDSSLWAPWDVSYDQDDALGRESHKTNYLAPETINNIIGLCVTPGIAGYDTTDEIDVSSLAVTSVLFKIKTKDGEGVYTLDTSTIPNAATGASHLNSKSDRIIHIKSDGTLATMFKDKDGNDASALFKSLGEGVKTFLRWEINVVYNRDSNTINPTISARVSISSVTDAENNRLPVGSGKMPESLATLIAGQEVESTIEGYLLRIAHNNINRSRYGQTINYANVLKKYNVRIQQPVSVKYPMDNRDVNTEILTKTIRDMGMVVSTRMTHDAFRTAERHFDYLVENNGLKVSSIINNSNEVLPGQYFFSTTAASETINLKKSTSTLESRSALENVQAVLVNKIIDVITEIRTRSGFSAVKEIDGRNEEYVIIAHSTLAPYLMTTGDVRTFGQNVKFQVVETNVDSEIGRFWIFPKSETKENYIDAFGGLGICVTKELLYIEGDVRQSSSQYRMCIAQPHYQHHALGCIAGRVVVEDIQELLENGGVLSAINRHLESTIIEDTNGDNIHKADDSTDDDAEIDITPGE